jgi:conserved hypothetical protein
MKGVITADVVGSTQIKIEDRGTLPALLNEHIREIAQCRPELKLQVDIFRGDSFQVWVEKPECAPLVALLLRAGLRMSALRAGEQQLDARISVGIGDVAYRDATVSQSDGEAFVLSGRGFDQLGKQQRLMVQTPSETTNEELRVETAFVDDIVSNWSALHSKIMYQALLYETSQGELAEKNGTSQQNVRKRLEKAKVKLIRMYLDRVASLIIAIQNQRNNP